MTKTGRPVFKGINSQAWAAMSLFLQYVNRQDFRHIGLEGDKLEDFHLVFEDGHKIICESKASTINYSQIRDILSRIIKHKQTNPEDDLLVICRKVNSKARSDIENFKFFKALLRSRLSKKGFTKKHLSLLPQVKFWEVTQEVNIESVKLLVAELLKIWVPDHSLKEIVSSLVVNKIYFGSQKGTKLTKHEFLQQLEERKKQIAQDSGYYSERENKEKQIKEIIEALSDPNRKEWANNQLSALTDKPDLHYFTLKKLEEKKNINLRDWDHLWRASARGTFSFKVFKIFKQNISNSDNKSYFLKFIPEITSKFVGFYTQRFLEIDIVRTCKEIVNDSRGYDDEVFSIVQQLFSVGLKEIFYIEQKEDTRWEREEISKLLKELYEKTSNNALKENIIEYIGRTFNLIKDDGEYWHYTPPVIFEILRQHAKEDVENRVLELKKIFVCHYMEFYKKFSRKLQFKGWEHMGGTTFFWGNQYTVTDRHFVNYILKPTLWNYYQKHKIKAWRFIANDCITPINKVSKGRPDFLNRASISIVLERYKSNNKNISREAFEILKEFILSRKGIPHKSDLVYQELCGNFPDDKKWQLTKVSIDKYKIPVNPFVEHIILGLGKRGDERARKILRNWIKSEDYYESARLFGTNVVANISQFLDISFKEGVDMFKDFIEADYFLSKMESFDAFSIARLLNKIIKKDIETGLEILETLSQKRELTDNEQIVLYNALVDEDNSKQENKKVLARIYETFLDPFLNSLGNDIKKIENKITRSQSREAIVQFADALAKQGKIREAIRIVKVFINDSDPCTPRRKNPEDPEGKYDEHKKIEQGSDILPITTVRGWCAWVLMNCAVLDGRDYIAKNIDSTEKLSKDQNYYVKHMACLALSQLAQSRLTVLPEKRDVLFLDNDVKKALEMSRRIEGIAFNSLRNISKLSMNVQKVLGKSILKVFSHIRALNQGNALKLIKTLEKFPEEVIGEAAPLFIYFAELRRNSFRDWKWKVPGLYDDLDNFDSKPFQQLLAKILKKKNPRINSQFSCHFCELIKHSAPDKLEVKSVLNYKEAFEISYKYLGVISSYYDQQTFSHIYRFIEDNFEKRPKECYQLWRKCLAKEIAVIKEKVQEGKAKEVYYWPNYENGKILIKVKEKGGVKEFLDSFEFLLEYPKEVIIGDSNEVVKILEKLPKRKRYIEQVSRIFNKLIARNPNFYDIREKWRKK